MASTFRRNTKGKGGGGSPLLTNLKGTKPSAGGITVTSSGLRDLDQILGSGQPLGTCIYLEQDRWTKTRPVVSLSTTDYTCRTVPTGHFVQAISHGQDLLIPVHPSAAQDKDYLSTCSGWDEPLTEQDDFSLPLSNRIEVETLLRHLPSNLNIEKERRKQATATATSENASTEPIPLESLQEEEEDEEDAEENLKIAWQYKKDVQRERHAGVEGESSSPHQITEATNDTFCHSFDLQRLLSKQLDVLQNCKIVEVQDAANGYDYFQKLMKLLPTKVDRVTRVLLYEPKATHLRTAFPLLLSVIREKKLPIVLLVAVKPWQQDRSAILSLQRSVDVVLQAEGFASRKAYPPPSEFRMFQGLLRIPKTSTVTAATAHGGGHFADLTSSKRPASDLYGLKRDRRKLHIQLLHIPPEDYAEGGGSVGGGGVRSGAGRAEKTGLGCASSGTGPMDF
eukprot:scaffold3402_cov169-Amphora_coffeaeformis.AAC.12